MDYDYGAENRRESYLKKVWCSMQTFHNRFEARWLGSLKPMVLSNCSYWGGEVKE